MPELIGRTKEERQVKEIVKTFEPKSERGHCWHKRNDVSAGIFMSCFYCCFCGTNAQIEAEFAELPTPEGHGEFYKKEYSDFYIIKWNGEDYDCVGRD